MTEELFDADSDELNPYCDIDCFFDGFSDSFDILNLGELLGIGIWPEKWIISGKPNSPARKRSIGARCRQMVEIFARNGAFHTEE